MAGDSWSVLESAASRPNPSPSFLNAAVRTRQRRLVGVCQLVDLEQPLMQGGFVFLVVEEPVVQRLRQPVFDRRRPNTLRRRGRGSRLQVEAVAREGVPIVAAGILKVPPVAPGEVRSRGTSSSLAAVSRSSETCWAFRTRSPAPPRVRRSRAWRTAVRASPQRPSLTNFEASFRSCSTRRVRSSDCASACHPRTPMSARTTATAAAKAACALCVRTHFQALSGARTGRGADRLAGQEAPQVLGQGQRRRIPPRRRLLQAL